jgi:hypothetical protein
MSPRTFVLCLIATAGCGSADPFAEIDAAECALIVRCGGGTADDEAACRSAYADHRARVAYSVNDAIASGRAEVDGARRGDCIASIRDADCVARSYDRCLFVVRGNVPPGGACQADMDCTDGFCERPLSYPIDGCDGVCRAYPKHGEPCTTRCVPTDYCDVRERRMRARAAVHRVRRPGALPRSGATRPAMHPPANRRSDLRVRALLRRRRHRAVGDVRSAGGRGRGVHDDARLP